MKKYYGIFCLLVLSVLSCSKYDDSELWNYVKEMNTRLTSLEEKCKEMNMNISSLQTLVSAVESGDYITNVVPVKKEGKTIGYTISFLKSEAITIYNGTDGKDGANGANGTNGLNGTNGKDGYTPVIGVRKDTDGLYYWTVDGEWLLDTGNNKVRASGIDGQNGANGTNGINGTNGKNGEDGITPQLKIEEDYWYVSYDSGATWQKLGKATGDKGDEGQSLFSSVNIAEDVVVFVLTDGSTFTIPIYISSTGGDSLSGIDENGHGWVDLGLPSGTIWATCNIGADTPSGAGIRFAWGETQWKDDYSWATYKYCNNDYKKMSKYCNMSEYGNAGFTDNLTELVPEDDAATVNWGVGWQMPSKEQCLELINTEYTTTEWTKYNGVERKGLLITSKTNNKSIFLPYSNYRENTSAGVGEIGYYWSRSLKTDYPNSAHILYFALNTKNVMSQNRSLGLSVRPVRKQ